MNNSFRPLIDMTNNKKNLQAGLFINLGSKYLNLAHNALEETIKSGNPHIMTSDGNLSWDNYFQETKWSDFRIIEPTLFCLYHGFELTIKGLILLAGDGKIKSIHRISNLYKKLLTLDNVPEDIKNVVGKYVTTENNNLISVFLTENGKDIDSLYESLRYPADRNFQSLNIYFKLHYQGTEVLEEYKRVLQDIRSLQSSSTKFLSFTCKE